MSPLKAIFDVIFPTSCACCGEVLVGDERQICVNCICKMSENLYSQIDENETERTLMGRLDFEHATSLYRFEKGNTVQKTVHAMKFHGNTELCVLMGRQMGLDLIASGRFDDVDILVPVPLHPIRKFTRGYNQSELLCRGIAINFPRPINTTAMIRYKYTRKQSLLTGVKRETNVEHAFRMRHPEQLAGKHILLVDDVLTSGATIGSCYEALEKVSGIKVSVASFSIAKY